MADFEALENRVKDLERRMHTVEDNHENMQYAVSGESPMIRSEAVDDAPPAKASPRK